jgi:hypothetical protein
MKKPMRIAMKAAMLYWPCRLRDAQANRRHATAAERFLMLRHSGKQPYRFQFFLDWVEKEFPEIRARMELRILPCRIRNWSPYVLFVPWLQDPVQDWTPRGYQQAMEITAECQSRGIPVLNPVDRLANSIKSVCTKRIASTGIRTPRIVPIENWDEFAETFGGLTMPLLIREDRGHGRPARLIKTRNDLAQVQIQRFAHPIASEFIDVRSPDGLYRKYRYVATGNRGVTRHLMIGNHWEVRTENRVITAATRDEELAYLDAPEPNHAALEHARRALELDVVAFDYSYDQDGSLVVWEANPYPDLRYPENPARRYGYPAVERSLAAVIRLYLETAGLPVPTRLDAMLAVQDRAIACNCEANLAVQPTHQAA